MSLSSTATQSGEGFALPREPSGLPYHRRIAAGLAWASTWTQAAQIRNGNLIHVSVDPKGHSGFVPHLLHSPPLLSLDPRFCPLNPGSRVLNPRSMCLCPFCCLMLSTS